MLIPNPKIFGSDMISMYLPKEARYTKNGSYRVYMQDFRLTQTHWKAIDNAKQRCDDKHTSTSDNVSTSACITDYLEQKSNCSMVLMGSKSSSVRYNHNFTMRLQNVRTRDNCFHLSCSEPEQLKYYFKQAEILKNADDNQIFEVTRCLSTCSKYEYAVQAENSLSKREYNQSNMGEPNAMGIKFHFLTGRYEVKEQVNIYPPKLCLSTLLYLKMLFIHFKYIVYSFNSLVADVGGYLGLLLGQSIYGLYHILASCKINRKDVNECLGCHP